MTFSLSTPFGLTLPVFSQEQVTSWFKNTCHLLKRKPEKNKKTKRLTTLIPFGSRDATHRHRHDMKLMDDTGRAI